MHIRRIIIFSTLIILLTIFINPLSAFRNSESKAIERDSPTPPIQANTCACAKVSLTVTVVAPAPARACKKDALSELEAAKNLTADKHTLKKIDRAIHHIQKSLDPDLWMDNSHLDPKHGHKVFDEEKKAVKELEHLIKDKNTPEDVKSKCQEAIEILVKADERLAITIHDEASAYEGDPKVNKELEKCDKEFGKAEEELGKGHYNKAIDHFKKAWKHAQHAIKKAA